MKKVFVLVVSYLHTSYILGVFSTRESADRQKATYHESKVHSEAAMNVQEWNVER